MTLLSLVVDPASYDIELVEGSAAIAAQALVAGRLPRITGPIWRRFVDGLPKGPLALWAVTKPRHHLRAIFATEVVRHASYGMIVNVPLLLVGTRSDPLPVLEAVRAECLRMAAAVGATGVLVGIGLLAEPVRTAAFSGRGSTAFIPADTP